MVSRYVHSPLDLLAIILGPMLVFKGPLVLFLIFTIAICSISLGLEFRRKANRLFCAKVGRVLCLGAVPLIACYIVLRAMQIFATIALSFAFGSWPLTNALILSAVGLLFIIHPDFVTKHLLQVSNIIETLTPRSLMVSTPGSHGWFAVACSSSIPSSTVSTSYLICSYVPDPTLS